MKKNIIDYLKNFIEIWDKKGSVKNLKFDAKDEDDFQEFVLYFQNMLGFSNAENVSEKNFTLTNLAFNDRVSFVYIKETKEYERILKDYPNLLKTIEEKGLFKTPTKVENEFLSQYKNYIFDKNKNILSYSVICATKNLKKFDDKLKSFVKIENFFDICNNEVTVSPKSSFEKIKKEKYTFRRVLENKFVEKNALESGYYSALDDLRQNQNRAFIFDLKTGKEIDELKDGYGILNEIRHNVSAHNNIYSYKINSLPFYNGRVLMFKKENIAIIMPKPIFFNILRELYLFTKKEINELYYWFYPNNSEKINENNLNTYLEQCKLFKITTKNNILESVLKEFADRIIINYKKIKKNERDTIVLKKYIEKELKSQFNIDCIIEENNVYLDKIKDLLLAKSKISELKILTDVGQFLGDFIKFFGTNILNKTTLYGSKKDYTYNPEPIYIAERILILLFCVQMRNTNQFTFTDAFDGKEKDFYFISIVYLLIYINFIHNKLIDNIKENKEYDKNINNILSEIKKIDDTNKIFTFCPQNAKPYRPQTNEDYIKIIKLIRNGLAHNNFAINYTSSKNIMDANIYFLNKDRNFKIVCTFRNFLTFITNDIFTQYCDDKSIFVADNFNDLLNVILNKFN